MLNVEFLDNESCPECGSPRFKQGVRYSEDYIELKCRECNNTWQVFVPYQCRDT